MKSMSVISTPSTSSSSARSTSTTTTMELAEPRSESSCYFPGCRKDANCSCEICLASINATLDLMPLTAKKTSLTKFIDNRKQAVDITPVSFDSSILSTPKATVRRLPESPTATCFKSTARVGLKSETNKIKEEDKKDEEKKKEDEKKKPSSSAFRVGCSIVGLILILGMELGFPWVISRVLRPELSPEVVRNLGERAFGVKDVNAKLRMLQRELQSSVNARISNCSYNSSIWEINQDGLLLSSRCVLYKSLTDEVAFWGWPLQTAGLLVSRFSSRSFTVLSGRVTLWPEGNVAYLTMKEKDSWRQDKYRSSAVQLDPNTWVLEYSRNLMLENKGLCSAVSEFLKYRMSLSNVRKSSLFGLRAARFRGHSATESAHVPT